MSGLIRLMYVSRATFEPVPVSQGIEPNIARILMHSRNHNPSHNLSGVLYYGDGYFFQCLEGQSGEVNRLMARIVQDNRHTDVKIVRVVPIHDRLFEDWSMRYIPVEERVSDMLNNHGLESFHPDQFNDQLIDELVQLFSTMVGSKTESSQFEDENLPQKQRTLWQRMFGFKRNN